MNKHVRMKQFVMLTLLFIFCCGGIHAQEQLVTVNLKKATLRKVFKAVEQQTTYRFSYRNEVIDDREDITVIKKQVSVTEVLDEILKGRNLEYSIVSAKSIVISDKKTQKASDNLTLRGVVKDTSGESVIGANIVIKGTSIGAITDVDGNFSFEAPAEGILVVSYIGYVEQELPLNGKSFLSIVLKEDMQTLDEVVVVGYGVQKKSSVTGAISSVKSEDMENRTITNAMQALQGKTAGVTVINSSAAPGVSQSLRIRGISSNGNCTPLYVVDGRIADDISGIDPTDIESMEVLKDAASAAIYGAQAGNGVILVTTKKGSGAGRISYDFQLASQSIAKVPKVMNAEQYIDYYVEKGNFTLDDVYKNWDFETNTDWTKVAFEKSMMQRHNLTFSGGNDRGRYYLSGSYLNNNGIVVGDKDKYERYTGMINASYKIKDWLEVGTNTQIEYYKASYVSDSNNSGIYGNMFLGVLQLDPLTRPYYTKENLPGNMQIILDNYEAGKGGELLSDGKGNYYGISSFSSSDNLNPLILRDKSMSENRGFKINGVAYANLTPFKGLTLTSRFGYSLSSSETYGVTFDYYANAQAYQNFLSVSASDNSPVSWQWENFVNYNKDFGKHSVNLMVGTSFSESRSFGVGGSYTGGDNDLGFEQDNPLFWYFAYATATATKDLYGGEALYSRKNSYYGRAAWEYDGKYFAQFSLRADAADLSILPKAQRWGYFPAMSAGWIVTSERFMEKTRNWLSHLKLRASWGQNGSTASLDGYLYATTIGSTGHYPFSNDIRYELGYAPSSTGNDELKWETSEQIDLGFDARFLNNRLSLSFDYFSKKTKDLIVSGIMPSTVVGCDVSPVNAGNVENKGIELELGWQDRIGDFSYNIRGNIATVKNKVTYLHPSLTNGINGTNFSGYGTITKFEIGQPAWYFYGYKYTGVDPQTGNPTFEDLNDDGSIGDSDKTYLGKGLADFTYGLTLSVAYKGLDLIVFGSGSQGNDIYCCLSREDYAINKLTHFTENRWSETNVIGTNPRAAANDMSKYVTSSACVFDGSYFKIKQIQLGYTLPKNLISRFALSNVRAYVSLEDFFTFTSYVGFDPETTGTGLDMGSYPTSRKVVLGFNVAF